MLIPIDPRAGEWRHEVLGRAFWIAAASVVFIGAWALEILRDHITTVTIAMWLGVAEGLLRRSSKLAILGAVLLTVALEGTDFIAANTVHVDNGKIVVIALSGAFAVVSAIGARNLLAFVFALLASQLGGLALNATFEWSFSQAPPKYLFIIPIFVASFAVILPATIGHAIWLGVKLSKRSAPRQTGET
jgi:hypothetical protein